MSQINPKEFVHKTAYSVQLPYIAGRSLPLKGTVVNRAFSSLNADSLEITIVSLTEYSFKMSEVFF